MSSSDVYTVRQKFHQWLLYPTAAVDKKQHQKQQVKHRYDEIGPSQTGEQRKGLSGGQRGEYHHRHEHHKNSKHHRRNSGQTDHLLYYVELHIFFLKLSVMFQLVHQLGDGLDILVARKHSQSLESVIDMPLVHHVGSGVLDVVNKVFHFLAGDVQIVLLAEVLDSV